MATQQQINDTYNYMDRVWRTCVGEHADISGAMYDGDRSLTLDQAQRRKHEFVLRETRFRSGDRVLDIGCGWGAFLKAVKDQGGSPIGLTLSSKQARHCRRRGFEAHLQDWKTLRTEQVSPIAVISSIGAFEHFCSDDEFRAGRQDAIYDDYFRLCHRLLPDNGRMYLQTMVWDKAVPDPDRATVSAPAGSDDWVVGLLRKFYPGSWLPNRLDHIERAAAPYFRLVSASSGRKDYIQTIDEWNKLLARPSLGKLLGLFEAGLQFFTDRDFRYKLESSRRNCNQECFRRELMDHFRIILEKK